MNVTYFFIDVLKYSLSGILVFFVAASFLKTWNPGDFFRQKRLPDPAVLAQRLQAYERLVLLVDRMDPVNLLLRLHQGGMSAADLARLALPDVRAEFQHNVAQQLYVSTTAWNQVKRLREFTLQLISNTASLLPEQASGTELTKTLLAHLASLEVNPYEETQKVLRDDMEQFF